MNLMPPLTPKVCFFFLFCVIWAASVRRLKSLPVPRKLLFWLHSREQPSPEGQNNIKRSAVSRGENTSKKTGQMSSKFGEIIKKLISVFGGMPARGLPKPPPTPPRPDSAAFTRGEKAILGRRTRNPPAVMRCGEKGRGEK